LKKSEVQKIKNFARELMKKSRDPQHDFTHLERVAKNTLRIIKMLKIEAEVDKDLLVVASYLHDVNHGHFSPSLINYFSEKRFLKKVLPGVLEKFDLSRSEKKIISEAIYNSPYSFPFKKLNRDGDLYSKILQDADTIDFFSKEREKSFHQAKKEFVFYKILGLFFWAGLEYGRKHLKNYLNFPELAEDFYV